MNASRSGRTAVRLTLVHALCLALLAVSAIALPKSNVAAINGQYLVVIVLVALALAQFSLLGFWGALGPGAWWRRMRHLALAVTYIAVILMPVGDVQYASVLARFVFVLVTSASMTGVMLVAFLIASRRRWHIGRASESVATGRQPFQFSLYQLHAITTVAAILMAFAVSMASGRNDNAVGVLVVNGFMVFVTTLTVISAVRASLGTRSSLPRLCIVFMLAVLLGIIPCLALRISAALFVVYPLFTTLPPLIVMASLLPLRASGIRLTVRQ